MRRLSKIAGVALAGTLVLAGCGSGSGSGSGSGGDSETEAEGSEDICSTADGDGPSIAMAYDVGGRGDRSFNDSAYVGLERAVDELGATCIEAVAGSDENDQVRAERLRTLAEGDYDLVIGVGFLYSPAAATVAGEYPETDFAVIDGFSTFTPDGEGLENLADLGFAEEQGSYLVGVAAALQTETDQIGFVGGVTSPLIKKFEAGYVAGAESVTPDIEIDIAYLTEDEADSETAFANPPGGRNAATPMYEGGADVVYHAAGSSGSGVFEAADAAGDGMWAIGVDSDQYLTAPEEQQDNILTSMLKRIDTAVFEVAEAVGEDSFEGGAVVYDLAVEGVGYSTEGGFIDDYVEDIDAAADQIRSGEVEVPTEPAQQ